MATVPPNTPNTPNSNNPNQFQPGVNQAYDLREFAELQKSLDSIGSTLQKHIKLNNLIKTAAQNSRNVYYNTSEDLKKINKLVNDYYTGTSKSKDVLVSSKNLEKTALDLRQKEKSLLDDEGKLLDKNNVYYLQAVRSALAQNEAHKRILDNLFKASLQTERSTSILGKLLEVLHDIPGIGKILRFDEAIFQMKKLTVEGENGFRVFTAGAKELFRDISESQFSIAAISFFLVNAGLKANKQTVELGKSLTYNYEQARGIRGEIAGMSRHLDDSFVTTDKLIEANLKLSQQLGISKLYSKDFLVQFVDITKKMGLSEESAAGLAKMSTLTGKTLRQTKIEALGQAQAISSAAGAQLDNKQILEEVGKISGQILANFKANPKALAEAVALAKTFGTNLQTARQQAEYLLNFQTSIESELKAELLLGRTLNYERARAAALQGDLVTAMKELNSQGITWSKFTHMNVLQQKSLAESMGITSDQLSDQLMKQELIHKTRSEIAALNGEEVANRIEQLTAQDKFNAAVGKLKDLLGNIVAGPLGNMLDVMSNILSHTELVRGVVGLITGLIVGKLAIGLVKVVAQTAAWAVELFASAEAALATESFLTAGIGVIGAIAGIAAGVAAIASMKSASDAMVGSSGKILYTKQEGAIKLDDRDSVIAGTNLFGKRMQPNENRVISKLEPKIDFKPLVKALSMDDKNIMAEKPTQPKLTPEIQSVKPPTINTRPLAETISNLNVQKPEKQIVETTPPIDVTSLIKAVNEVRSSVEKLNKKDTDIYMDGRRVGSTLMQGSTKLA